MFRRYSYDFPTHLIPAGSGIVVYGASDMGRDYGRYVFETAYCRILFYADRNHENIDPPYGCDVVSPERIKHAVFDYILIASTNYHEEILEWLLSEGIADEKLIRAEIPRPNDSPSSVANLYFAYFVSGANQRKNGADVHPIHRILLDSLDRYRDADLLEIAEATKRLTDDFHACDSLAFSYPYEDERYFYGYLRALMRYGNYRNDNMQELPEILHGVFGRRYRKSLCAPFVLSCDLYQRYDRPVFETGPYIRYADSMLSGEEVARIRKEHGKILLVFPTHDSYFHKANWEGAAFRDFLKEKRKQFDSVFVCLYFLNLSKETLNAYRAVGSKIVTCGVRTDQDFVRKNLSLLEISDAVVVNSPSSSLSFAIALHKPILWFDSGITLNRGVAVRDRLPLFEERLASFKAAANSGEYLSKRAIQYGKDLYCCDQVRSPEEIRAIFEMNELIYERSHGDIMLFQKNTERYLNELAAGSSVGDRLKYRLLSEAVENIGATKLKEQL
jgi:hypothetical protein